MSLSVGRMLDRAVENGKLGRGEVQTAAEDMLDGGGVKPKERELFNGRIDAILSDRSVFVAKSTRRGIHNLQARLDEAGLGRKTYAPGLDKDEIRSLLSLRVAANGNDISAGEYTGRVYTNPPTVPRRHYSSGEV